MSTLHYTSNPELPVDLRDPRIGIEDPAVARVVASLLSRTLADHRDEEVRHVNELGHCLQAYARATARCNGKTAAAPFPDLEHVSVKTARRVHRELGITFEQLRTEFQRREREDGSGAAFDVELLCNYFVPPLWRVTATLITDGPALATQRLERHLQDFAGDEISANNRGTRAAGRRSLGSIKNRARSLRTLMRRCTVLRWDHPDARVLEAWTGLPDLTLPEGESAPLENTAPPWHLVRHAFASINSEVWQKLGVDRWENEESALRKWPPSKLRMGGLFLPLRDRALLSFLSTIGPRRKAALKLSRGDYVHDHLRPDGRRGPAINLTPAKTRGGRAARWKPLPDGLALIIDTYLLYIELRIGRSLVDGDPLWVSEITPEVRRMSAPGMYNRLAGRGRRNKALLRRDPADPYTGYAPHTVRAAAAQSILSTDAQRWLEKKGEDAPPLSIAEALLDHEDMKLDEFGYHGAKKPEYRERLSAIGAELNWLRLTTELGARKIPDADCYRKLLHRQKGLWDERQHYSKERRRHRRQAAAAAENGDLKEVMLTNVQADTAADHENEVVYQLGEIKNELTQLRLDPRRLFCVPDDVRNEDVPEVDLDEIEREVNEGLVSTQARRLRRKRDVLTPSEYAALFDHGESSVRRWRQKGVPPRLRKNPFKEGLEPWVVYSSRRVAIHADAINPDTIDTPEKAEKLAEALASELPDGWAEFDPKPKLKEPKASRPRRRKAA